MDAAGAPIRSAALNLLHQWQKSLDLNDLQFAAHIGRTRDEWSRVKRGIKPIGRYFAGAVLARAPEPWRSGFERAYAADLRALAPAAPAAVD